MVVSISVCSNMSECLFKHLCTDREEEREGLFTWVSSVCGSLFGDFWVFIVLINALSQPSTSALKTPENI